MPLTILKLSAASCGESSILKKNKTFRLSSLTPQQATGNAPAGGFNIAIDNNRSGDFGFAPHNKCAESGQ
jgi:hypothetical protein